MLIIIVIKVLLCDVKSDNDLNKEAENDWNERKKGTKGTFLPFHLYGGKQVWIFLSSLL